MTSGPKDRTPGLPGSDKNVDQTGFAQSQAQIMFSLKFEPNSLTRVRYPWDSSHFSTLHIWFIFRDVTINLDKGWFCSLYVNVLVVVKGDLQPRHHHSYYTVCVLPTQPNHPKYIQITSILQYVKNEMLHNQTQMALFPDIVIIYPMNYIKVNTQKMDLNLCPKLRNFLNFEKGCST